MNDIIRQAELWATGATIHDVKALIGMWWGGKGCYEREEEGVRKRNFGKSMMVWANCTLLDFMRTGSYRKALDINDLPVFDESWNSPNPS